MNYILYFLISIICINYSLGNIQEIKNIPEVQVKYSDLKFYQDTSEITIDITDSEKKRKIIKWNFNCINITKNSSIKRKNNKN